MISLTQRKRKSIPLTRFFPDLLSKQSSYWYRMMFDEHFPPHCASTVKRWIPNWSKQTDPSGR